MLENSRSTVVDKDIIQIFDNRVTNDDNSATHPLFKTTVISSRKLASLQTMYKTILLSRDKIT